MSLERELVFQLREEGNSEADVLEIVKNMGDPEILQTKPVKLNPRLVKVALTQYQAGEELKKRKDYVKKDKEKLKELIQKEEERIKDTTENFLSVEVTSTWHIDGRCENCSNPQYSYYYARVTYLNNQGGVPTPITKIEYDLFSHCDVCGYTKMRRKDSK
ncbi:MAG: hypothetical protein NTU63_00705 [Candidatus Pacearchaeota archaeon]|nr:hypothetical protein [Candidatus Pacearchaeota archaeon]